MGFAFSYESTDELTPDQIEAIRAAAREAVAGYTWLSCEPVRFDQIQSSYLSGRSKPTWESPEADAASAAMENLPDGTLLTMLEILCDLSHRLGVNWEIHHDHSDGPIGQIVNGECDPEVRIQCEAIAQVTEDINRAPGEADPDEDDYAEGFPILGFGIYREEEEE